MPTGFFQNMLSPLGWTLLALIPPAIIALYFLKLKRQPLEVPSTYLWKKSLEDMHVNSLWQRLRKSILLFLQLLILLLAIFALLRPGWRGTTLEGERFVLMIDNSASMSATDVKKTRLEKAKALARTVLDGMEDSGEAMIITFAGRARVVQQFTSNVSLLRKQLDSIEPSAETTSLQEAITIAAGLANPPRVTVQEDGKDVELNAPRPATAYIFTDGRFPAVKKFSLGDLSAKYVPVGTDSAMNVAVAAFNVKKSEDFPDQQQAFARIYNAGKEKVSVVAELYVNKVFQDGKKLTVGPKESTGVVFTLAQPEPSGLEIRLLTKELNDALKIDDIGYAPLDDRSQGKVLVVTSGNIWLEKALSTARSSKAATIDFVEPSTLKTKAYQTAAANGDYELIIFDGCRPEKMPRANTVFFGRLPPSKNWKYTTEKPQRLPILIDWNRAHPVMANVEMGDVDVWETHALAIPKGGVSLLDARDGPLMAIGSREQFQDIIVGFPMDTVDANGERFPNTTWRRRHSFPVFWLNVLEYLAGEEEATKADEHKPGENIEFAIVGGPPTLSVIDPNKKSWTVHRGKHDRYQFQGSSAPGIYKVVQEGKIIRRFAVNLFDTQESDISVRKDALEIGFVQVEGQKNWKPARKELWRWLIGAALLVLLLEWYIYNRRVYL